ncbi:hypothetical protein ABTZ89_24965, partial [Saccharopolyspora sp. NPDC002686]
MSRARELPGGGRAVEVVPERVAGWFDRFAVSHGGVERTVVEPRRIEVRAGDGGRAVVDVPFGPLPPPHGEQPGLVVQPLVEHLEQPRRIGLVLVRLGAHSVGIARGGRIERSTTGRLRFQGLQRLRVPLPRQRRQHDVRG